MSALAPVRKLPVAGRLVPGIGGALRATARMASLVGLAVRVEDVAAGAADEAEAMRRQADAFQDVTARLVERHGVWVRTSGAVPAEPCIVVANHLGYLDPLLLPSLVRCQPIAKVEAGTWPLIGPALHRLGLNFVDRGCAASGARALRRARRALRAGVSVLVFPEGTTTYGDTVLPFHRGIFGIARQLAVPVVPTAIRFDDRDTCWVGDTPFGPHYLRTAARRSIGLEVQFGAPQVVTAEAGVAAEQMRRAVDALRRDLHGTRLRSSVSGR